MKALEATVKELDAECERAQKLSPTSVVLEEVLQVRQVPMPQTTQKIQDVLQAQYTE